MSKCAQQISVPWIPWKKKKKLNCECMFPVHSVVKLMKMPLHSCTER